MDMIGALHFDLGNQSKYLINSVNLRIKLERNKDAFALMSASQDFKIVIQHASLFVRKVKVAPSILIAHETALSRGAIKMPLRRKEVKSFALSSRMQYITIQMHLLDSTSATNHGLYHKDQDINIGYSEYKDGYTLLAIDLTPDLSADGMHDSSYEIRIWLWVFALPFFSIYWRFLAPARQPRSSATLARMSLSTSVGLRPRLRPP
ncbi:uncharacterized protein F54H12.2 [Trichonephila clavata]|uniref:Uncharacterized protein F54H12.2 n=1 Tax=Trichonephila clavata TaxID=2740835 RepID=A0A8X6LGA7_TRICU|nr:uncharacterized protein F54H12.2 [Trichonephila clavata]